MSDSHNDDPFAPPSPEPVPDRANQFGETPVEAFARRTPASRWRPMRRRSTPTGRRR